MATSDDYYERCYGYWSGQGVQYLVASRATKSSSRSIEVAEGHPESSPQSSVQESPVKSVVKKVETLMRKSSARTSIPRWLNKKKPKKPCTQR